MQVQTFTKAYLVEFTDKISGYRFLKFGATNNYDVYQRFQHEPEQYKDYDIEVIGSIYAKQKNINYKRMGEVEDYFLSRYHRNTKYFKDNFSGISETYQPGNDSERNRIIKEFYDIKTMILRGEDIKDVIKENEEGDGTVRDFDRRASESFQDIKQQNLLYHATVCLVVIYVIHRSLIVQRQIQLIGINR